MGLHIGFDAEKIVVSPYPLEVRGGRARRSRLGSVTEVVPAPASGRGRKDRARTASQLALVLVLLSAVLSVFGVSGWSAAAGSGVIVAAVVLWQARAARVGSIALPRGEGAHVLYAAEERTAFERAVVVARRVRGTWPALHHMIDPDDADRNLAGALEQLAAVMSRRQQIRQLREELAGAAPHGLPAGSPAVRALAEQRLRVEGLWRSTAGEANRILASINAAALAGENLIREQRIGETAREAELAISRLTVDPAGSDAGPELAERTAAVIAAYRELAAGH
ncbi:hypothetical protein ACFQFC_15740 [Amorphoplanes digitatis]|uniref:Uncharacterized protein n=1 Tax=Actinoplanes digitatis TaxID=1868 RepID=A0A7W7MTD5_9ACTN|nr:hypothetical protein [Actinoplanes digitatis]MBB4765665.1 hypothetical protein [Actinoplanes digitatis]GID98623.1 hypothetical protein Adi01nite_80350 [Actinoplanes digitatis]